MTGETSPAEGSTEAYTVGITGDALDGVITLTSSEGADTIAGLNVTFVGVGARTITATVTSATASDSGATGDLAVTVV